MSSGRHHADESTFAWRLRDAADKLGWPAAGWALIALAIYALEGKEIAREGGPPLARVLVAYGVAAVAAVLLLAALRPLAGGWLGKGIVSTVVAWPVALVMWVAFGREGGVAVSVGDLGLSLLVAAFAGPFATAYYHVRHPN